MKNKAFLRPQPIRYMQRRVNELPIRQRFLIVCEGKKTEPNYFSKFRVPGLVVQIAGLGMNTVKLVEGALKLREEDEYNQTWCVFDKDNFPDKNFNNAIDLARRNGIEVAYSNQSFELWYLLHFDYLDTAVTRKDYMDILDEKLNHKYRKNSETIFNEICHLQSTALKRARKLLSQYKPCRPASDCPSTTVHLLVEQLLKYSSFCKK